MRIENQYFGPGEMVPFESREYVDCTFERCTWVFTGNGKLAKAIRCKMVGNIEFSFEGPAAQTISHLRWLKRFADPDFFERLLGLDKRKLN